MITIESLDEVPNGEKVIFRAHGEPESVYKKAEEKNLEVIDLTCGKVMLIHEKVKKKRENSFIIIVGKKNHPEVIATKGFAGKNSYVIETEDDILDAYMEFETTDLSDVYVVSQTTISSTYFDKLAKEIETNFIEADVLVDKTTCNATEKRQEEVEKLSQTVNKMIIIGGKHSSNTKELAKIADKNCKEVYLVETLEELINETNNLNNFSKDDTIGIMAGASTPQESIEKIEKYLLEK
jgi:4-hydroxy-3-methylbut-2-enyl diphosphate reductase